MKKIVLIFVSFLFISSSFAQIDEKVKARKLSYNDFQKLSINDTSAAIIDLFFSKKDNAVFNQMSLLPLSVVLITVPPMHFVGVGSLAISVPLFLNGGYILVKYRKKKLYLVLTEYAATKTLPKWVRRKTNRLLNNYETLPLNY